MKCQKCGKEIKEEFAFCQYCGSAISHTQEFMIVTTPSIPGYKIKKVLGIVTGLTPRTRGVLGKFVASFQSMLGGEVTAFTTELEKARIEAIDRVKYKARALGANAITGLDLETSDLGLQAGVIVISATGTAVIVEAER
ncbi:heavy metal-binding domain-containing protein [[Eubacterium] cellulosolvens]